MVESLIRVLLFRVRDQNGARFTIPFPLSSTH